MSGNIEILATPPKPKRLKVLVCLWVFVLVVTIIGIIAQLIAQYNYTIMAAFFGGPLLLLAVLCIMWELYGKRLFWQRTINASLLFLASLALAFYFIVFVMSDINRHKIG
uniref:Uncharacterized protein n=1 Tax=Mucochytrium quahogii TaxID=96639 RepID=A0A7S2RWG7_9STRA|mmetsp:Transcript_20718/g.34197  ORF Transcript_20718/g.34197 Transcript_20718/m.34197 type:complete len:110 (-) Transcript_20718:167-496(-)